MNQDSFNESIYNTLTSLFPKFTIHASGINGVSKIVLFDEPELNKQKSRYRIAYTSMMVFDGEKPILGLETIFSESSIPPRIIVGPIPVYMITRKIIVRFKNGNEKEYNLDHNDSKIGLMIVLSPQKSENKKDQIKDLNEKFRGVLNLDTEYSYVNNFRIIELDNLKFAIKEFRKKSVKEYPKI